MKKTAASVVRIVIMTLCVLIFAWFCISIPYRIMNIGTYFGLALCVLLFLAAAFSRRLWQGLWKAPKHKWIKVITGGAAAVFLLCVGYACVLTGFMIGAASQAPADGATVVVLGCKVNGTSPSLMLLKRLEAAERYLKEHPGSTAILSGGQGRGEDISEAQCMFDYLTAAGIEESRLILEDKSTTTLENIRFSRAIIVERSLSREVAIVTDGFHELRAANFAEREGLTPSAVPAKTPWFVFPTYYVRELFGLTYQFIS